MRSERLVDRIVVRLGRPGMDDGRLIEALASGFPSLAGVSGEDFLAGCRDDAAARLRVEAAIEAASCDGEWPGRVEWPAHRLVPHVGDRYVTVIQDGAEYVGAVLDMRQRPSSVLAAAVLAALKPGDLVRAYGLGGIAWSDLVEVAPETDEERAGHVVAEGFAALLGSRADGWSNGWGARILLPQED